MSRRTRVAIQQAAGIFKKDLVSVVECSVVSVDMDNRQITVAPTNGSSDAQFIADISADPNDGMIIMPTVGSTVKIARSVENNPFVLMFSDIDGFNITTEDGATQFIINKNGSIQFNDGSFGGLTKTKELKIQIDKDNEILNIILTLLTGSPINEPGNGAPSALQAALSAALAGKAVGNYSQIENTKITHGE